LPTETSFNQQVQQIVDNTSTGFAQIITKSYKDSGSYSTSVSEIVEFLQNYQILTYSRLKQIFQGIKNIMIYNRSFRGGQTQQAKVGDDSHAKLSWGAINNYQQWCQCHARRGSEDHGIRANIVRTGGKCDRAPIGVAGYTSIEANGPDGNPMPPLTAAEVKEQRKSYMKQYNKQVANDINEDIKFFGYIEKNLSDESLEKYTPFKESETLSQQRIHHFRGDNIAINTTIRRKKQKIYAALSQRSNQSVAEFHRTFLDATAVRNAYDCHPMTEAEYALDFIYALNDNHNEFKLSINNDGLKGAPLPKTVNNVVELAENFIVGFKSENRRQQLFYTRNAHNANLQP